MVKDKHIISEIDSFSLKMIVTARLFHLKEAFIAHSDAEAPLSVFLFIVHIK